MKKESDKHKSDHPERKRILLEALLSGVADEGLRDDIRRWFAEDDEREVKDSVLDRLADHLYAGSETASESSLEALNAIRKRLGYPEAHYQIKGGRVIIPDYKSVTEAKKGRGRSLYRWGLRGAAVLLPLAIAFSTVWMLSHKIDFGMRPFAQEITVAADGTLSVDERVTAGNHVTVAENTTITLPDNSTVRIAGGSKIHHAEQFQGKREVRLQGAAHFNVTKAVDADDCFTVHTGHLNIAVLGTEFDVCCPAGEDHSTIDLLHGSVRVTAGEKEYLMKPGEHLRYCHLTNEMTVATIPVSERRYDRMPELLFEGEGMMYVFDILRDCYGVAVEIAGHIPHSWDNIRVNMTNAESIEEVLQKLSMLSDGFEYVIAHDKLTIIPNANN